MKVCIRKLLLGIYTVSFKYGDLVIRLLFEVIIRLSIIKLFLAHYCQTTAGETVGYNQCRYIIGIYVRLPRGPHFKAVTVSADRLVGCRSESHNWCWRLLAIHYEALECTCKSLYHWYELGVYSYIYIIIVIKTLGCRYNLTDFHKQ